MMGKREGPKDVSVKICNGCKYLYTWTTLCPSGKFFAECQHPESKMDYWQAAPNNIGMKTPGRCPLA